MKFFAMLFTVLAELAVGSALLGSWQNARRIRKSYFELTAGLSAAIFLGISLWQAPALSPFLFCFFFAAAGLWSFHLEHFVRGRLFLKSAGLVGLTLGLYTLADVQGFPANARWLFLLGPAAGALLLGGVHATMVLGHWYLLMRDLEFSHLQRACKLFALFLGARALLLVATLLVLRSLDPNFAHSFIGALLDPAQDLFFFCMRLFWGLLLPGALAVMIWKCAKSGSNQSATGLLYLAEVSILIGETMAVYLKI